MTTLMENLTKQLRREEGEVKHKGLHVAYQDHLGFWTIGIGRLIDKEKGGGLSDEEVDFLLRNDIMKRLVELRRQLPFFDELDMPRQGVLLQMAFQLGVAGMLSFKTTLQLVRLGKYKDAAIAMLDSKWARQTPARARRLAKQMETGQWVNT